MAEWTSYDNLTTPAAADTVLVHDDDAGAIKEVTRTSFFTMASGEVLLADTGTVAAPSISISGDPDTGLSAATANTLDVSAGGVQVAEFATAASGVNYVVFTPAAASGIVDISTAGTDTDIDLEFSPKGTGSVIFPAGTVSLPGISFTGDPDTGFYASAANTLDFTVGGVRALSAATTASGVNYLEAKPGAAGGNPALKAQGSDTDVNLKLTPKGTGAVVVPTGTEALPGIAFAGDTDTGVYSPSAGIVAISGNALRLHQFNAVASSVNFPVSRPAVTGSPPAIVAGGSDANIDIELAPKGSGVVRFGTHTALGAETVSGYITINDSGGTTRLLAVVS